MFDVHQAGSSQFTCGDINTDHGYQLMEAFNYAVDYVNRKQGIFSDMLENVTLGSLVLDACKSPTRAGNLVANVHSQILTSDDGSLATDAIMAYIGAYDSDSSKQMANVLSGLEIPQISYGSISSELQDQDEYPYFLRTVPGDQVQANGMVALLRRYEINYVQLIHSPDSYGEGAAGVFAMTAGAKGVCVAQTLSFDEGEIITNEMANRVVSKVVKKPLASVVVVYLATEYIHPFLEAVDSNPEARGKFVFLGSEAWEKREDVVKGVESAASGSVTFGVETSDITGFDTYLNEMEPGQGIYNGWFDEYYQEILQCSLQAGDPSYPRICEPGETILNPERGYEQDSYVIYTVNAVYAAAVGINSALEQICGKGNGVCDEFYASPILRTAIYDGVKGVSVPGSVLTTI